MTFHHWSLEVSWLNIFQQKLEKIARPFSCHHNIPKRAKEAAARALLPMPKLPNQKRIIAGGMSWAQEHTEEKKSAVLAQGDK